MRYLCKGSSIKDFRTEGGRGVCQMQTLLLIFACKKPKYDDTGEGVQKTAKFCGRPLWMAPKYLGYWEDASSRAIGGGIRFHQSVQACRECAERNGWDV